MEDKHRQETLNKMGTCHDWQHSQDCCRCGIKQLEAAGSQVRIKNTSQPRNWMKAMNEHLTVIWLGAYVSEWLLNEDKDCSFSLDAA